MVSGKLNFLGASNLINSCKEMEGNKQTERQLLSILSTIYLRTFSTRVSFLYYHVLPILILSSMIQDAKRKSVPFLFFVRAIQHQSRSSGDRCKKYTLLLTFISNEVRCGLLMGVKKVWKQVLNVSGNQILFNPFPLLDGDKEYACDLGYIYNFVYMYSSILIVYIVHVQ